MKISKFILPAFIALAGIYAFTPKVKTLADFNMKADTQKSQIDWMASKKNGYHPGTLSLKSGGLMVENGKITGGQFVIDFASLKVTDGAGEKLAGHLKSPDFFDVAKFSEATYEITGVKYTSDNTADITGNLTLKGLSVPVNLTANIRSADAEKGLFAEAFFSLNRETAGIAKGNAYLSNDIQIAVHLFATK